MSRVVETIHDLTEPDARACADWWATERPDTIAHVAVTYWLANHAGNDGGVEFTTDTRSGVRAFDRFASDVKSFM